MAARVAAVRIVDGVARRVAYAAVAAAPLAGCAAPSDRAADAGPDTWGPEDLRVELVWYPGLGDEDWDRARRGLWWALSNLGAAPPDEAGLTVDARTADAVTFTLDLGAVGFPEERLGDVAAALAPVQAWSDAPVDVGRFLMATLHEPGRYYAITGACASLDEWRAARQVAEPPEYAVTLSQLTRGDRLVWLNPAGPPPDDASPPADTADADTAVADTGATAAAEEPNPDALDEAHARVAALGWLVGEGEGSLEEGSFFAREHETVDVMPNGQQRFAVYDDMGQLRASTVETTAGPPGRCMWCHESRIQRGASTNPSAPGYLDYAAFAAQVDVAEAWMARVRAGAPVVDFVDPAVHQDAERLTLVFLEPSVDRVAREWGLSEHEVRALGLPTRENPEFPELGPRYARADVDAARVAREPGWAPFATPPSDRELDADWPLMGAEAPACSPGAPVR